VTVDGVLFAPVFDEATVYSHAWCQALDASIKQLHLDTLFTGGRAIARREAEAILADHPTSFYVHYGHGSEDAHWGSASYALIDLQNVDRLTGRDVYCMNCLSAKRLGVEAHRCGCTAYWGYIEVFSFSTECPDDFRDFANCGLLCHLQGNPWSRCVELARELAATIAEKLINAGQYIAAILLQRNSDALRCWDGEAPPTPEETWWNRFLRWLRDLLDRIF